MNNYGFKIKIKTDIKIDKFELQDLLMRVIPKVKQVKVDKQ